MSEFVKVGERILAKPNGCDYDLLVGKTYTLKMDGWNNTSFLTEASDMNIPEKVYYDNRDKFFLKRVLDSFNADDNNTTGVLLAGLKGSGKTLTAKMLAQNSNLPVIIVDNRYDERYLGDFFNKINTPVCILFDEIDKGFHTERLLQFLDGIQDTTKKLVVFTCNKWDEDSIDSNLIDRCSRNKYFKEFTGMSDDLIDAIVTDNLKDDPRIDEVKNIIKTKFDVKSFDNILSFVQEVNKYKDETVDTIVGDLNITFIDNSEDDDAIEIKAKSPIPVTISKDIEYDE